MKYHFNKTIMNVFLKHFEIAEIVFIYIILKKMEIDYDCARIERKQNYQK